MNKSAVVALVLALATPAFAQLQQGIINGKIVGPDGTAIIEAHVILFDQLGNAVMSVTASNGEPIQAFLKEGVLFINWAGMDYDDGDKVTVTFTPLPAALPLFAGGLGALGVLGWRRKRQRNLAAR